MSTFQVASRKFDLDRSDVENAVRDVLADPIRDHFVVVGSRRFPPKQVLSLVTGLDRADFTTHQARRVLKRLGFVAARKSDKAPRPSAGADPRLPHGGSQAAALEPHRGKWVALGAPDEVLVTAESFGAIVSWLAEHELVSSAVFRVPAEQWQAEVAGPL